MKKKLVLALLSTSILSTMLAGCKVSTDTGATNTNSNTTETKEATSTDTAAKFIRLLLEFGEYSGVGIKTGLGMGAIQIIRRDNE